MIRTTFSRPLAACRLPVLVLAAACLTGSAAHANPPVDEMKRGLCLDLKVDGALTPCDHSLRLIDDGKGTVTFVTGYGEGGKRPKTIVAVITAQTPDMENAYGYALRVTALTVLTEGKPESERQSDATGLCFMVKPNPVRAGTRAVTQDIVVMCSVTVTDGKTDVRKLDWKFVF